MTAKDINCLLHRHFHNYEYKLNNTYVFDWESDFFAKSKSGYFIECEVKISRSDFFVDFKKDKHHLFKDVVAGKTHHVSRGETASRELWGEDHGRNLIAKVETAELQTSYGETKNGSKKYGFKPYWRWGIKNGKSGCWVNDYGKISLYKRIEGIFAPFTGIRITPMTDINLPHRFYYVVPDGLVKPEEVPKYAGLLYVDGSYLKQVKAAPFLHKNSMDLHRLLLKKYYNLWTYKVPYETKMSILNNYSESNNQS